MARPKKQTSSPKPTASKERSGTTKERSFHLEFKHPAQKMAWTNFLQHDLLMLLGPAGCGKAQPLNSLVFTPNGPKRMGEIKVGDEVCIPNGGVANVEKVFPQGMKKIYKITFKNGNSVKCCSDHLWKIQFVKNDRSDRVVDTNFIIDYYRNRNKKGKLAVEVTKPVHFKKQELPINPYLMGILLGDGCFKAGYPTFTTIDSEIVQKISMLLDENYSLKSNKITYCITKRKKSNSKNIYTEFLRQLELWGLKSKDKFVPEKYLYSSVEDRIAILQGLMDSDGTISKKGMVSFTSTSKRLADNVKTLCESLGGVCSIWEKSVNFYKDSNGERIICQPSYTVAISIDNPSILFSLSRKANLIQTRIRYSIRNIIENIEECGIEEAQCIYVNSNDHLYLTDNFIVTHNTFVATAFAINEVLAKRKKRIIITRPIVEAGESLGFLPGDLTEKTYPYMLPIYDCITKLVGKEGAQKDLIQSSLEICPLAYLRGRTLDDAVCILDEAQNATYTQMKLFVTRLGENSKIIITGDPEQSDLPPREQCLEDFTSRLSRVPGIGMVTFGNDSIVRNPLIIKMLEVL